MKLSIEPISSNDVILVLYNAEPAASKKKKIVSTKGRIQNRGKKASAKKDKKGAAGKGKIRQNGKPSLARASTLPLAADNAVPGKPGLRKTLTNSSLGRGLTKQKSLTKSASQNSQVSIAKSVLARAVSLKRSWSTDSKKKEALKKAIKKVAKEGLCFAEM